MDEIDNLLHKYILLICQYYKGDITLSVSLSIPFSRLNHYTKILIKFTDVTRYDMICHVWCPGQNKRIAPLSFLHGCRKKRLKD
jgi:hypothetical protein